MQPRGQMYDFHSDLLPSRRVLGLSDGKEKEDFPFMGKGECPEKWKMSSPETLREANFDLSPGLPLLWPVAFSRALPVG